MRYSLDTRTFRGSATDLANHARCPHLTQRARERAVAIAEGRDRPAEQDTLVMRKGREFEARYVAWRRAEVEIDGGRFLDVTAAAGDDPRRARELLAQAIADGVELIAQAPLASGSIFGYADLLERVGDADHEAGFLGTAHRYEPVEVKYARSVQQEHLLQACAYADALAALQGELPTRMHVVTGDARRTPLLTSDFIHYYRASRERFGAALELDLPAQLALVPDLIGHCARCDFASTCDGSRLAADHLSIVARIRRDQRTKLIAHGITTLTELATARVERVPGISAASFLQLRVQARLQLEARAAHLPGIEYRAPGPEEPPGRGFAMLPAPDAADMFFDFEGYPYHEAGALEYLWGWTSLDADGARRFDHIWADDLDAEASAFSAFLDEVHARRARASGMHVYHYAPYEVTALRRLAHAHPHEQERLDELLRAGVFVDLYAVVRQTMLIGTPSYSIKQLEPLYGIDRSDDDLADGGESIEVYEHWLASGDTTIRDTVIAYNRVDCDSTLELRDWLLEHRERARAQGIEWPARIARTGEPEPDPTPEPEPHPVALLVERLDAIADDAAHPEAIRLAARLLSAMPGWQRRTSREFFGELHARAGSMEPDDWLDDHDAVAGLTFERAEPIGRGSLLRHYRFPDQVTLAKDGNDVLDARSIRTLGTLEYIDHDERILGIRTGRTDLGRLDGEPLPTAIICWTDIQVTQLEQAARAVAEGFLAALDGGRDPFHVDEPHAAALAMLARRRSTAALDAIASPPDPADLAQAVIGAPGSYVLVQGPPGTGKTWTSARLVAALVDAGLRVGISSNSHAAVINVLDGIDRFRREDPSAPPVRAAYPLRSDERAPGEFSFGSDWIERPRNAKAARAMLEAGEVQVLAGTAWLFACDTPVDVMLVDEAGQVSLLHATAMASCARRVVLVGDPQQLPQPSSAKHPHGCDASILEHLFEGEAVLPRDRAVLLPVTRRMHPDICRFVSDSYYRGELHPHPSTTHQYVDAPGLPRAGTLLLPVEHAGNRVRSDEEVTAISELVGRLLTTGRVIPKPGADERAMRAEDIIVVAPYNAQRRALQEALGANVRVGTVDKFQGQEAPVAILSMTASSRDELPRGLEFLLDPHRFNVAVSRARSLAIVVTSPSLLATTAGSVQEMRLLNDLARYAATSSRIRDEFGTESARSTRLA